MTLLREIQNLASTEGDITTVLRKCNILAAHLASNEFAQWIDWELNGYPESQPIPSYRRLHTTCNADFMNIRWRASNQPVPFAVFPQDIREVLVDRPDRPRYMNTTG
jgi:hypothetical protein